MTRVAPCRRSADTSGIAGDPETNAGVGRRLGAAGLAIKAIASEVKLPVVSGGALDQLGCPPTRISSRSRRQTAITQAVLDVGEVPGMKRVALLLSNDAYGQGEAQTAKEQMRKLGLEIAGLETFSPSDTNFTSQLVRLRGNLADILYVGASGAAGILIFKQIRNSTSATDCFMLAAMTDAFFQAIGGAAKADGLLTPGLIGMLGPSEGDFGRAVRQAHQRARAAGKPCQRARLGHRHCHAKAIERSDGSREGIRGELDRIRDLPGINGPITFTPQNHIGQDPRGMAMIKLAGGKFVPAPNES